MTRRPSDDKLVEMLRLLIECKVQAEYDLCGEQREWHCPRLNRAFAVAAELFPHQFAEALNQARDPWGGNIAGS